MPNRIFSQLIQEIQWAVLILPLLAATASTIQIYIGAECPLKMSEEQNSSHSCFPSHQEICGAVADTCVPLHVGDLSYGVTAPWLCIISLTLASTLHNTLWCLLAFPLLLSLVWEPSKEESSHEHMLFFLWQALSFCHPSSCKPVAPYLGQIWSLTKLTKSPLCIASNSKRLLMVLSFSCLLLRLFIFCANAQDMLSIRWGKGCFFDTHLTATYFDFPSLIAAIEVVDFTSGVVKWFPVNISVSNSVCIPETFAIWSTSRSICPSS